MLELDIILLGNLTALFVGFSKTGIPGAGIFAVLLMANISEATKASVGNLLPLLIVADCMAVAYYKRHTQWRLIRVLFPWVAVGIGLGWLALEHLDENAFRPLLAGMVGGLMFLDQLRRSLHWERMPSHPAFAALMGVLTGFCTTVGNVAGPVMILYLMSHKLNKNDFMGSMAWFFLIVNCTKVPIFALQGMMSAESLLFDLTAMPGVFIGAWIGRHLLHRIPEVWFVRILVLLIFAAAIKLLF